MKKLLTLMLLIASVCAYAQHLKFVGIPLDGTISSFHEKLVAKGYKPDTEYNSIAAPGARLFLGTFFGKKANIHTYYNPKTKVVYRAKACIEYDDKDRIISLFNEVQDMLKEKYETGLCKNDTQDGFDAFSLIVLPDNTNSVLYMGIINLYISTYNGSYPTKYVLHIDYVDKINADKNVKSNSDDL